MIDWNALITELDGLGTQVHAKLDEPQGGLTYAAIIYSDITVSKETVDNIILSYFGNNYILHSKLVGEVYKSSLSELDQ